VSDPTNRPERERHDEAMALLAALESSDEAEVLDGVLGAVLLIEAAGPEGRLIPAEREVVKALERLARAGDPPAPAAGAVFALGKRYDPGLEGLFLDLLREHVDGDANVLYQAMIALANLDVPVFAGRDSMSVFDTEINRTLARKYLAVHRRRGTR
jgi:hypothetical protein